jgi:hypothetical protein
LNSASSTCSPSARIARAAPFTHLDHNVVEEELLVHAYAHSEDEEIAVKASARRSPQSESSNACMSV